MVKRRIARICTGGTIEKICDEPRGVLHNELHLLGVMRRSGRFRGFAVALLCVLPACYSASPRRAAPPRLTAQEPAAGPADGKAEGEPRNKAVFAVGGISAPAREDGVRLGFEYERLWNRDWGLLDEHVGFGVMIDLDTPPVDTLLLAFQIAYHPLPPVKIVVAPGVRLREADPNQWTVRTGMSYEFDLGKRWLLGPEFFVDLVENRQVEGVVALALTRAF